MKDSKTPKIVVGVGLVAVYGALALYFLRDTPDSSVMSDPAMGTTAQSTDLAVPTPSIDPASADLSASLAAQPAVMQESAPVPGPAAEERAAAPAARTAPDAAAETADAGAPASEIASAGVDPAIPGGEAPSPVQGEVAASGNDSQITAEVKTQIAAVAPASTIDVTTTNGVVELSGSVPSHEEINKVVMAARNVENVRGVDGSALMVAN